MSPIPKTRPVQSENDLRPISLTPTLATTTAFALRSEKIPKAYRTETM